MSGSEEDTRRQLMRWANGLPFGRAGFHVTRTTDDAAIANAAAGTITFNNLVDDAENWWAPGASTQQTFTVPAGLSGVYHLESLVYAGGFASFWQLVLSVNGAAVTRSGSSNDGFRAISATVPLNDGDTISVILVNFSGGAITPTAIAAGALEAAVPYLIAYRISLL